MNHIVRDERVDKNLLDFHKMCNNNHRLVPITCYVLV